MSQTLGKKLFCACLLAALILMAQEAMDARARVVDGARIMDQQMGENLCALTFDDGPSRNTARLLDLLAQKGIRATFFVLGQQAERNPGLIGRILDEGHELGNHSWSHPNLRLLSAGAQEEQIRRTDALLRAQGANPQWLRPPYGAYDPRTIKLAQDLGLDLVLWSLDSLDWKARPEDYARLRSARGTTYPEGALRGIFLFHDTHLSTVEDLPRIIANLRAGGCSRFVTVSEYLDAAREDWLDPEPGALMSRRKLAPAPEALAASSAAPASARLAPAHRPKASPLSAPPLARCARASSVHLAGGELRELLPEAASLAEPGQSG